MNKLSEFTIEANPESVDKEKAAIFLDNGVNRISIGIQSFSNTKLKKLGRIHDGLCAEKSVKLAHESGFKNISIDMIFGVREETLKDWKIELEKAANLPIKHISCYSLDCRKLECGSEKAARMYEYAIDFLSGKGFKQYEISNFAKDGFCCAHNLNYWDNSPYIGLGPSAVSYIDGVRKENTVNISDYIKMVKSRKPAVVLIDNLNKIDHAKETAAVKIRTMEGINFDWFGRKTGFDFLSLEKEVLPGLSEEGLIEYAQEPKAHSGIILSRKGILFCDIVSSAFL